MIPKWGEYLSDLTLEFSRALENNPGRRGTLAICLPRIEFAWCFVVFGFARSLAPAAPVTDHAARLRPFIGHKVTLVRGNKQIKGMLAEVPESSDGEFIKVSVSKTSSGARLKPGKSLQLSELLRADEWPSIRVDSESKVDETAGFRFKPASAPEVSDELLNLAGHLLGNAAKDWLVGPGGTRIAAYGARGRMMSECNAKLELQNQTVRVRLSEIVKPSGKGFVQSEGRVRLFTASSLCSNEESPAPFSWCVVEPLSRTEQVLQATKSSSRILLLARNAPAYAESASAIVEAYRHRSHGELCCSPAARFPSIFHQSFFHS